MHLLSRVAIRITQVNTEKVGRALPYMIAAVMFIKASFLKN